MFFELLHALLLTERSNRLAQFWFFKICYNCIPKFRRHRERYQTVFQAIGELHWKGSCKHGNITFAAELRLKAYLVGIRDCKEIEDSRKQSSSSLESKVEICNVNAWLLKLVHIHVNAENSELATQLGISSKMN